MSKHLLYKGSVIALTVFQFLVLQFAFLPNSEQFANAQAAPFTSMSVTVANGRLSFKGAVATSGYINTTTLRIAASGQPDNDTRNLFNGDAICVNPSGDICHQQLTHPVNYLATDNITFGVSTAFPHDIANATPLVASQSGRIIVSFRPRVAVPAGGSIRVYIPANATNTTAQNGIPDADGFDSARIDNISAGSFGSVVVPSFTTTAASITYTHASSNHVFSVPVTTTPLNTSTTYYITIGDAAADRQLFVNPAPCLTCQSGGTAHTTRGLADPYNFRVESLDASSNLQDSTTTSVAVNDGVLVSVTVPLSLTYQISAVTASTALSCPGVSGG
ncbi:MAG TPA: hypothetical protein VK338_04595, partial [Candidatus Nitrosocosmicus sp.]|nr:hypothetical protein [Candidatus Nitrosocosmicus sp.]